MTIREFGTENDRTLVFFQGSCEPWQEFCPAAQGLVDRFHVMLVTPDGHDPEEQNDYIYFHLACGTLIHNYNVIYEAAQGDAARAVAEWNRSYAVQAVPYWVSFFVLGITSTGGWIALVLKGVLPLKKSWALAAPLLIAGIGFLLELILPLPFNGLSSGFESFGWIVMFLGGIQAVKKG